MNLHIKHIRFYLRWFCGFMTAVAIVMIGFPGQSIGFLSLTDSILETTQLSRNVFSELYMVSTYIGCLLVLMLGGLTDRLGLRKMTLWMIGVWVVVMSCMGSGEILRERFPGSKMLFYGIFWGIGLSLMRCLGQSFLPMLGRMQLMNICKGKEGLAIGISGIFISLMMGFTPRIMRYLNHWVGWQGTYKIWAWGGVFIGVLAVFVFPKKKWPVLEHSGPVPEQSFPHETTFLRRRQVIKLPIFWCVVLTLCVNSFIGTGVTIHLTDIFRETGRSMVCATNSYLYMCVTTIVMSPFFGWMIDKGWWFISLLLMMALQITGLVGLEHSYSRLGLIGYIGCIGATWGAYEVLMTAVWKKLFHGYSLGKVLSLVYFLVKSAGALSPVVMSYSHAFLGSYFKVTNALIGLISVMFLTTLLFLKKYLTPSDLKSTSL